MEGRDAASDPDAGTERDAGGVDGGTRDSAIPIDSGERDSARPDPDAGAIEPARGCAETNEAIVAATEGVIRVSPMGDGVVMVEGAGRMSLRNAIRRAEEGDTVLLEDGVYTLPEAEGGGFSGIFMTTPNVTVRGASGNAADVIIDSAYRLHGGSSGAISVDAPGVTLANFTVRRAVYHLIHLWADGDDALIHNVVLLDGGQQFLKASPGSRASVDNVEVSCSTFRMTTEGRDNVWGYGALDGNTSCYTGGIDSHDSRDWHIHDSYFEGIYCNPDGPRRPVHGRAPGDRGDQTYVGGLSEHAIHMWDSAEGSGHLIERNRIVDCARGIGLGFRTEVYGSLIRNNMIFSRFAGSREHDVGIGVERARDTRIDHNTVFYSHPDAYPNRIEFRFDSTANLAIRNNLVNGQIRARNGASADMDGNITDAEAGWFADAEGGDLHLASCEVAAGSDVGAETDYDGAPRSRYTIGADECE